MGPRFRARLSRIYFGLRVRACTPATAVAARTLGAMVRETRGQRITRRRALAGVSAAGLGALGATLLSCSGSSKPSAGAASGTPSSGAASQGISTPTRVQTPAATVDPSKVNKNGTLNARQANPFATMNPYKGLDAIALFGYTVFDHLTFQRSDTGENVLMLAASLEQPDPQTFTYKLKPAMFHNKPPVNGRAVKAADIVATYSAIRGSRTVTASAWWRTELATFSAIDDQTFQFTTNQVDAWTLSTTNAGSPLTAIILPQEIAGNIDFMDSDLIGSGPYQFVSQENGTNFKVKRFENWRVKGEPWLAGINYKLLQQQSAAIAAFAAQQIDSIGFSNKLERDQVSQQLGNRITTLTEPTSVNWMVTFKGDAQFADPRVRQAIYLGFDRDEFIQLMYFGDATKTCHVPPVFQTYTLPQSELQDTLWKFDPQTGRQLLQAAGFDTSKTYQLKYNAANDNQNQMGQITQQHLQKNLGLKVTLVTQDLATWLNQTV